MMSQGLMRWVDRWVGCLLCFVLTVSRRIGDLLRPSRRHPAPPSKIVFIKLIEQGATVLAHGAVQRAAARVGRDNVYFCVFAENRAILDLMELVPAENVLAIESGLVRFPTDLLRVFLRCRRDGIDTTIDMEFLTRAPAIIAYLSGAKHRVGLHRFTSEAPYRGDLMTHRVQYSPYLHTAETYSLLVEALDAEPGEMPMRKVQVSQLADPPPSFDAGEETRARVRALIAAEVAGGSGAAGPDSGGSGAGDRSTGAGASAGEGAGAVAETGAGPIVLLNPNAGDLLPLRRWDTDRFVELGKRLLDTRPDLVIGITGAPSERSAAEAVGARIGSAPRVISLAGKTTLRELLALYSVADVLVTNDSGPGHFASLTEIHNVVMFGPETPRLFGPLGGRPHVIWEEIACSPCVSVLNHRRSPCTDNVCMQGITVDRVYREVLGCLEPEDRSTSSL